MIPDDAGKYLDLYFEYHQPTQEQVGRMSRVNEALRIAVVSIFLNVPASAERTLALRALEEARMRSNQAIVVNEKTGE